MGTFAVFLVGRRHPDHAANLTISCKICSEHTEEPFSIEAISLCLFRPSVYEDAGWLDDIGWDAFYGQQLMEPEAVPPSLKAAYYGYGIPPISPSGMIEVHRKSSAAPLYRRH